MSSAELIHKPKPRLPKKTNQKVGKKITKNKVAFDEILFIVSMISVIVGVTCYFRFFRINSFSDNDTDFI